MNGKTRFKIWARHRSTNRTLNGSAFHIQKEYIKSICKTLRDYGWTIHQLKEVAHG